MLLKERLIYIIIIVILSGYIIYNLTMRDDHYIEVYENQIKDLEEKLVNISKQNEVLDKKLVIYNDSIKVINKQLGDVNTDINHLNKKTNEKVTAVNSYTNNDITRFFTERYPNTITPKNSQGNN